MMASHDGGQGGFILDSIPLMTTIDIIIIVLTLFATWSFYSHRETLRKLEVSFGVLLCLGGLVVISLFYLADLYTMFVLPLFVPMADAMRIMDDLHLNFKWIVTVIGVGMIVCGIIYLIKILLPRISKLLEDQKSHQKNLEIKVLQRTADLKRAKREAEKANEAKSKFLSQMSHELRTPLNAVLGYGELLLDGEKDDPLTEKQLHDVKSILGSGEHLLKLIQDLLDLSKIEQGNIQLDMKNIDLMDSCRECEIMITPLLISRKISLKTRISDKKPCYVYADKYRLTQVLVNLISNAIKYNAEAGVVHLSCEAPSSGRVRINVKDTGEGIPEKMQHRLFNAFDRLGKGADTDGAGIGLTVTKHLVEAMGGSIGVISKPGEGSTFWIDLAAQVQAP